MPDASAYSVGMGAILIAYERESEQNTLEQVLTASGHRVLRSANGLDALDAARREPPVLALCDVLLPKMDGFALFRKWQQDERLRSVPFIFYTTRHNDPKYERFALELGVDRFLSRSTQPETLLKVIEDVLRQSTVGKVDTMRLPVLTPLEPVPEPPPEVASPTQPLLERIAELETLNAQLSGSAERFRRLFESNPTALWLLDVQTQRFIAVNDAALSLYGFARPQFLELAPAQLLAPARESSDVGADVTWHQRRNGSPMAISLASQPVEFDGRSAELTSAHEVTGYLRRAQELADRADRDTNERRQLERLTEAMEIDRVERQRREALLELSVQRAEVSMQAMVDTLCRMVERHDPYTAGSAHRVAELAVALGREIGLDGEKQHTLRVAALLHDIGSVTVPAELLARPSLLSEQERELVRSHAAAGARLLAGIDFQGPVAEIVHQHHERPDGGGYPRGLKANDILIEALVLAVADVVEAMCSKRSYRPALGLDAALEEIEGKAGSSYDSDIATACVRLFRQHGWQFSSAPANA